MGKTKAGNAYLHGAIAQARASRDAAVRDFGGLDAVALNWKPEPDRWSVAQCLDHLIATHDDYSAMFRAIAEGTYQTSVMERVPILPSVFGPLVRWAMAPDSGVSVKTTKPFVPSSSELPARIVVDFRESVDELVARIASLDHVDHGSVVVRSPFVGFVCYRLRDAVQVAVSHLERHRRQALRVTEHEGFPAPAGG